MADVTFQAASRSYDAQSPAVDRLTLDIADGEFIVLVGPSGSGKSTALRMLAGLEPLDSGKILIGGEDMAGRSPKDRDISMVFQNYALFPHLDVAGNMEFGLKLRKVAKAERTRRVQEAAEILGLGEYLKRKPSQLSGGQRQRVAMGRAIVREPKVFLMDEPLSNLDAKLRTQTRAEIASLQRRLQVTAVYVTHDQVEAMTMGDRVAVMRDGVLQQVGTPRELYDAPVNTFVAGFIGSPAMNLRPCRLAGETLHVGEHALEVPDPVRGALRGGAHDQVVLGLRPEACRLTDAGLPLEVDLVEELGSDAYVYGRLAGEARDVAPFAIRVSDGPVPVKGDQVRVGVSGAVHLFDAQSEQRLDLS